MMVLVTRPGEDGKALCRLLRQRHIQSLHHPLIEFKQGHDSEKLITALAQCDIVIAVSQHAVYWASKVLHQHNQTFPHHLDYIAIGNKTAQCLEQHQLKNVISPKISDSEHLLDLPALKLVKNKRILILRGNSGRELIHQILTQRGALVEYNEIYHRVSLPITQISTWTQWKGQGVSHLVITSGEQLTFFMSQVPKSYLLWVTQLTLYVPSQRIYQQAEQIGFSHIINTGSADNLLLLDCLSKTFFTGQNHD